MNAQWRRALGWRTLLRTLFNDRGNHVQGTQRLLRGGGNRCGVVRAYSVPGKSRSNRPQCLWRAFHDIVAHGAVDMNVDISRDK